MMGNELIGLQAAIDKKLHYYKCTYELSTSANAKTGCIQLCMGGKTIVIVCSSSNDTLRVYPKFRRRSQNGSLPVEFSGRDKKRRAVRSVKDLVREAVELTPLLSALRVKVGTSHEVSLDVKRQEITITTGQEPLVRLKRVNGKGIGVTRLFRKRQFPGRDGKEIALLHSQRLADLPIRPVKLVVAQVAALVDKATR